MESSFFSESFNNVDEPMVNPANGTLSMRFKLASISSGINLPVTFDLYLDYRPIDGRVYNTELGYLRSWVLSYPRYIRSGDNTFVQLSNGSIQPISPSGELEYHKRQDIHIEYLGGNVSVHTYKDGTREYFFNNVITKKTSPIGHEITFNYDDIHRENPFLERIFNNQGDSIDISINGNVITITQTLDGTVRKVELHKKYNSHARASVLKDVIYKNNSIEPDPKQLKYSFTYEFLNGNYYISTSEFHNGNKIALTYDSIQVDDTKSVPFISKFSQGLSSAVYYRNISQNNYTGYQPGVPSNRYIDECFHKKGEYNYETEEVCNGISIKRIYNKFHCLIREVRYEVISLTGQEIVDKYFDYHNVDGDIYKQSAKYLELKSIYSLKTDSKGNEERKVEHYTSDDYGNITSITNSRGVTTERYYSEAYEGALFKSNLYREVVSYAGKSKETIIEYTEHTGHSFDIPYTNTSFQSRCMLPTKFSLNGVRTKELSYVVDETIKVDLLAIDSKKLLTHKDTLDIKYNYSISLDKVGAIEIIETYSWSDFTATKKKLIRYNLNQIILELDFDNIETIYEYDTNNVLINKQTWSNTEYPYVEEYEYYLNESSTNRYVTKKDGSTITLKYDSKERKIEEKHNDFVTKTLSYTNIDDTASYTVHENAYDKSLTEGEGGQSMLEEYIKTYTVTDDLIQKSVCNYNGNSVVINRWLGTNSKETFANNGDVIEEFYNHDGELTQVKLNNNLYIENTLDIFNRVVSRNVYSELGSASESTFTYDDMDRVTQEIVNTSEGSDTYNYTYPSLYIDDVSKINVESTLVDFDNHPNREIDPLGRVISEGHFIYDTYRKIRNYHYRGGESIPYRISNMFGMTVYECEIDKGIISSETTYDSGSSYRNEFTYERDEYNRISRCIATRKSVKYLDYHIQYNLSNSSITETNTFFPSNASFALSTYFSRSGNRVTKKETHLDKDIKYHYDNFGRLIRKQYTDISGAIVNYDNEFDLPRNIILGAQIFDQEHKPIVFSIDFTYDSNGVELSRKFIIQDEVILRHSINKIDEISKKTHEEIISRSSDNSDDIRKRYIYSALGELSQSTIDKSSGTLVTDYKHGGISRIKSALGNDGRHKTFSYDGPSAMQSSDQLSVMSTERSSTRVSYDVLCNADRIGDISLTHDVYGKVIESASKPDHSNIHDEYEYFYNHKEQLVRLLKKSIYDGRIKQEIIYIYSNDKLIGEVDLTNNVKTLYIRFKEITLAKYSVKDTLTELTIFCTDRSGTVLATYAIKNRNRVYLDHNLEYMDYSDYGNNISWNYHEE